MELLKHFILFFLAAFVAYGHLVDKRNISFTVLVILLPTAGVYWLGGWGLFTYIAGYLLGIRLFVTH
jgi:hypothetical protein